MGVPEVPASLRSVDVRRGRDLAAVNAAEPLETLLTLIAEQACELIGFDHCAVMLADDGGSTCTPSAGQRPHARLRGAGQRRRPLRGPPGRSRTATPRPPARSGRVARSSCPTCGGPRVRQAAAPRADAGLPRPAAAPLRGPFEAGGGHRRLLGPRAQFSGPRAGADRAARPTRPRWRWRRHGCGPSSRGHPRAVPGQRRAAPGPSRAGVGRAAAPRADGDGARRRRARGIVAARSPTALALRSRWRTPTAGCWPRARRVRLPPAPGRRGPPPGALGARRAGGDEPAVRGGQGAGAGTAGPRRRRRAERPWVAPVVLGGELAGRLVGHRPARRPGARSSAADRAVRARRRLELLRQRHLRDVERRLSGDLLGDLLRPGGPTHDRGRARPGGGARARPVPAARPSPCSPPDPPERGCPGCGELVSAAAEPGPALWSGRTRTSTSSCCPPNRIPVDALRRVLALAEQALARRGLGHRGAGRFAGIAELRDRVPRRPGRGPAAPGAPAGAVSSTSATSGSPRCCWRRARPTRCAASPSGLLRPVVAHDADAAAATCCPRCGPGSGRLLDQPRPRPPSSCTPTPSPTGSAASSS